MQPIAVTATIMNSKISITIAPPDNKAVNKYWAKRLEIDDDAELIEHRARAFDDWATLPDGMDKDAIFDIHKNHIMIRLFEAVGIEKN